MKIYFALLAFCASILSPPFASAAEKIGDWSLNDANETATIVRKHISTQSTNELKGADASARIELGYSCNGEFYLLAPDPGFAIDKLDCGPYGCKKHQNGQLKFDNKPFTDAGFEIWIKSEGMYLLSDKVMLQKEMKAGNSMTLELELARTDGQEQMATFSLRGFTAAHKWCAN